MLKKREELCYTEKNNHPARAAAEAGPAKGGTMQVDIYIAPDVNALLRFLGGFARGGRAILFCEDRLTLEAERAVAAGGAVFGVTVTSFARFLGEKEGKKVLSKQGSVMVVGAIAAKNKDKLRCFGRNPAGCAVRLYETIAQLRAALVTPAMLEDARAGAGPMLADKLADIALVYREYLAFLGGGYLDESGVLALLPAALARADVAGADICFAGFSAFTRQAAEGIAAACRGARSVTGAFIGGEEELYTNEAAAAFEKYCARAGAACVRHSLPGSLQGEAEALRRSLFDPALPLPLPTSRIHLYEAADRDDEFAYIAAAVRAAVHRGARYADIAVFLPDVAAASQPLEKAFGEYGIPYYAELERTAAEHPLSAFLLRWLAMLAEGFDPADTDAFVGNPFFGEDRRSCELYRNYLAKYANYRGGARRPLKEGAAQPLILSALREKLLASFEGASASMTGGEYCALCRRLLDSFRCEERQAELAAALEREGLRAESAFFSRGCAGVRRVLDEAAELAAGTRFRAEEFAALLGEGLKGLRLSLIPQYLDAVFVGDISHSRRPAAKIVFAADMTDAVPAGGADTALITDRDIDRLRTLAVEISPKIREVNARVRENVGLAVSGFSERLYLLWPLSAGGKECRPSELIGGVRALFRAPGGKPLPVLSRAALRAAESADPAAYRRYLAAAASAPLPAARELYIRADEFRRGRADFSAHTGLYAFLRERGEVPARLFEAPARADFVPAAAQAVLRGKDTVSPTLIEGYFHCPYRNFAERGLSLAEREEASVRVTDSGNFVHELLRRLAAALPSLADEAACEAFLEEEAGKLLGEPPFCYLPDTGEGSFSASALAEEALLAGRNVFRQIRGSSFTVAAAEQTFGYPSSPIPGIPLRGAGRTYTLAGKIDRVDRSGEYARVVDYKTGRFDVGGEAYYTGRKLQLPLYLAAASAGGRAAGAYYFPAGGGYAEKGEVPFRMKGFTLDDDAVIRLQDNAVAAGEKSRFIDAGYLYKGRKSRSSIPPDRFPDFLEYAALVSENGVRETERGCIAPSPYDDACQYCPYGALCGRDPTEGARKERSVSPAEIAEIVRRRKGE